MHVQLSSFVDICPYPWKQNFKEEMLRGVWGRRYEEASRLEDGIGGPSIRAGDGEKSGVLWEGGENLEGFGQFARSVATEQVANPMGCKLNGLHSRLSEGRTSCIPLPPWPEALLRLLVVHRLGLQACYACELRGLQSFPI